MSAVDDPRAGPSASASAAQAAAPGAYGVIVGEIITDLVTFAVAHATGRTASARVALAEARMRLDELHGKVNAKRAVIAEERGPK